jgi:sodium/potassium/calcium exchanger 6
MSESLAGVTFLAFGNGSPDVFSTFAAMSTNSGSLAIGELIGAAGFITTVVAGSMAFVHPFKVAKKSFVRDVSFFIVSATFSMVFLYDGKLYPWEAASMVGIYIFYVVFVVIWHWWFSRRRRIREIEAAARAHFVVPGTDAMEFPEYHDEETENQDPRGSRRGRSREDFSALERGGVPDDEDEDEETTKAREERVLGEINRNMRLNRPRVGRRRLTHNPVRPSLIGVLEFRSVVAGLHKSGNTQSIPLSLRRYSDDPRISAMQSDNVSAFSEPRSRAPYDTDTESTHLATGGLLDPGTGPIGRMRAISAPEADAIRLATDSSRNITIPQIDLLGPLAEDQSLSESVGRTRELARGTVHAPPSPSISVSPPESNRGSRATSPARNQVKGVSPALLAPPDYFSIATQPKQPTSEHSARLSPAAKPQDLPTLSIPQSNLGGLSRDGVSPTAGSTHLPSPSVSPDSHVRGDIICLDEALAKPLRWWPYSVLPPPGEFFSTLFPTLCAWHEKNYWEKLLGIVAAPSVFFLTITLPVVESDSEEGEKDDDIPDLTLPGGSYGTFEQSRSQTNVTIIEPERSPSPDEEHFARESRNLSISYPRGVGGHGNTATVAASAENFHQHAEHHSRPSIHPHSNSRPNFHHPFPSILSPGGPGIMASPEELHAVDHQEPEPRSWNRWLIILQIFTAPFFIVLIAWAKMDLGEPMKLIRPTLISLACSFTALAIILVTTTPTRAPKWRPLICFLGFCVSIAWISTVADEVVGVLKTVGVILNISDAILGLTIFAVGNSLGDLVADITVAKLGYPVMALSACFGGPMLNILLGVGLSGLYLTVKGANEQHDKHPGKKLKYKPYHIEVSKTLIISGATLLVTLLGLLVVVPLRRWKMDRFIGWSLIALWTVSTIGNVVVEIMGLGMSTS